MILTPLRGCGGCGEFFYNPFIPSGLATWDIINLNDRIVHDKTIALPKGKLEEAMNLNGEADGI